MKAVVISQFIPRLKFHLPEISDDHTYDSYGMNQAEFRFVPNNAFHSAKIVTNELSNGNFHQSVIVLPFDGFYYSNYFYISSGDVARELIDDSRHVIGSSIFVFWEHSQCGHPLLHGLSISI